MSNTDSAKSPSISPANERRDGTTSSGSYKQSSGMASGLVQKATDTAREQFEGAKEAARDLATDAQQQANNVASAFKEKARDIAEEQKARGSEKIDGIAEAIHGVADEVGKQIPAAAGYVREAAKGVEQFSSSLRNSSVDDLIASAYRFARNQPLAFFGASVLAGFAASRFLKSSAERVAHANLPAPRYEPPWEQSPAGPGSRFPGSSPSMRSTQANSPSSSAHQTASAGRTGGL
jgi:vacuolar-type H+-ATPase subunit H